MFKSVGELGQALVRLRLIQPEQFDACVSELRTGRPDEVADLPDTGVRSASFSKDGNFLAIVDREEIRVWRLGVDVALEMSEQGGIWKGDYLRNWVERHLQAIVVELDITSEKCIRGRSIAIGKQGIEEDAVYAG